jgi:hypothetical protein
MRVRLLFTVIILSALVLQGCSYTIPIKEGEPTAQITFTAPRGLELKPLVQMPVKITLLDSESCAGVGHVAGLIPYNKYSQTLTVPANKNMLFSLDGTLPAFMGTWICHVLVGITPTAGNKYEVRFDIDTAGQRCPANIFQLASNGQGGVVRTPLKSTVSCKKPSS